MKYTLESKINYSISIPAISCEWNGRKEKGWGIVKGYQQANGARMYVIAKYGNINNATLCFESELSEINQG